MKQKLPTTCRIPHTLDLHDTGTINLNSIEAQNSKMNYLGISHKTIFTILLTCILSLVLGLNSLQAQISNAPPNEISPWVTGTYSNLVVTIIDDVPSVIPLCVGSVIDEEKIIDNNLEDPGTISFGAAVLGCDATISVADPVNDYTAGTWAGFRVGTGGLLGLNVGLQITISTYIDGNPTGDEQTFDAGLISANLLSDNIADVGITTTANFDEVRIRYQTLVGVAQLAEIYHASIVAFGPGPELACNTTTSMMRPIYPMSISEDNTNLGDILAINASSATNNVIDSDPDNFATLNFTLGPGSLSVKDELTTYTAGTFAGFDMESTSLLSVGLLDDITITTYLDGVQQEIASGTSDGILALNTSILNSGNERSQIGFVTTLDFDEVKITGTGALGSMNVYGLSLKEFCPADPSVLVCNTPVMATEPDFPLLVNGVNTGISGVGLGAITNTNAVIDADDSNFATIDLALGVGGSASLSVLDPIGTYPANTYTGFDLETGGLLNLDLLNSATLTTYLDGNQQEVVDGTSEDLLAVDSGLLFGNAGRYQIGFVATQPFDEVQITFNEGLVSVDLGVTNVYGVILQELCEAPIVCDVTQLSNPDQPVIINSEATGANGIAGVGATLENVQNVISEDETDFATVSLGAGVGSSISISVLNPLSEFPAGSQAGFMIQDTNDFLQLGLLDQITVSTYLDGVEVDSQTSSGLVLLQALGLIEIDLSGGTDPESVQFVGLTTTGDYDEVRIEIGSLVSALEEMEVYGAYVNPRTIDGLDNNPTIEITSIGDDNIINVTESEGSVPVVGTAGGDAVEGDAIIVTVNGVDYPATVQADNSFTVDVQGSDLVADTSLMVLAEITHVGASCTTTADTSLAYTIDLTLPTVPTVNELVTNDMTPEITGTADSADDLTVEVNGITYTEGDGNLTDNTDGTWTLQVPAGNEISEGVYDVVATATNIAGNSSVDTTIDELTVDTTDPDVPTVDTLVTSNSTPAITGTANSVDDLTVEVNGIVYTEGDGDLTDNGDGTWILQIPVGNELPDGVYDVVATATDVAGNVSTDTTVDELTIDSTAPFVPTVDVLVTNSPTPEITGTANSADELTVEVDGITYTEGDGNLTDNGDDTWTLQVPVGNDISDGVYDVVAIAENAAGTTSTDATTDELTIDTIAPSVPTVDVLATNNQTPEITGTADSVDELTVEVNGIPYTEGDGNLTDNGDGTWTLQVPPGNEIPEGVYDVVATAEDAAGNTSMDATVDELTIDITAPTVPTVIPVVTSNPTPAITGTADSADELTVEVNGITYAEGDGNLTDNTNGTWTLQIPAGNDIPEGIYDVIATATDVVGNTTTDITTNELTIDSSAPLVPTVNPLVTNNSTPEITGTADSADELTVEVDGVVYTEGDGNLTDNGDDTWILQVPTGNEIPDGVYDVLATATDTLGNVSTDITTNELTIDSSAPMIPTVNQLVTNSPTPTITGTADSADELSVGVNGVVYTEGNGDLVDNGNNTWTLQIPAGNEIPDGVYDVVATVMNTAGNTLTDATADELTIDSTGLTMPTINPLVTQDPTPEITGTADSKDDLTVEVNGVVYTEGDGNLVDHGDNTWTLQIPDSNEIPAGIYDVVATVTDEFGKTNTDGTTNELTLSPQSGTIPPTVDPLTTVDPSPTITGTAISEDDLTIELNGVTYTEGDGYLTDNGDDTWSLDVPEENELPVGVYDVIATVTGDSGNTSTDTTTDELTIDNPPVSDITITKTADNMNPLVGDMIKFTVTVINTGGTEFSAVEVDEVITSGFTYQRHTASLGNYQPTNGRWSLDELNANQTATLEIWVQVNPTGNHTNIASITASTPSDDDANNDAEVIIELNCLQVFNEFTPNFDGYNDYFRIECIEQYPNSVLKIFNKYGNKVYEVQGYQNDWTGIANVNGAVNRGKELPAGVYFYSLVVSEQGIDKSGWLYIAK